MTYIIRFSKLHRLLLPVAVFVLACSTAYADEPFSSVDSADKKNLNWYNLDPLADAIQGASIDKAYREILSNRAPAKKIVVAVIDGGVDIHHTDLAGKIWTNAGEIADNGLDDDQNGYVDDIHGWNYLGNQSGENIQYENYEYVRIYKKYDPVYGKIKSIHELPDAEKDRYKYYLASRKKYQGEQQKYETEKNYIDLFEITYARATRILEQHLQKDTLTQSDLKGITTQEDSVRNARDFLQYAFDTGLTPDALQEFRQHNNDHISKKLNLEIDYRAILSDDPTDINDRNYGNNDVKGPSSQHGTFVAGIIAAGRDNGEGINGVAEHAEIMAIRAVPDGDEYDKDIALAIRYAVDNGASIINMSFGKDFSPQKRFVDEALKYAAEKNVLVVHSAGNDAKNIDKNTQYPSRTLSDGTVVTNFITVGATNGTLNEHFVADFSNYGRKNVDLFAPGVDILSLYPDNRYNTGDGTSFSGPVVSGVAALVWSCYPDLKAAEVRDIILRSATRYRHNKVNLPDEMGNRKKITRFGRLSDTGGIVNAYKALLLAERLNSAGNSHN